jgi:hypothetical protein
VFEIVLRIYTAYYKDNNPDVWRIYTQGYAEMAGISGFARTYWRAYRQSGVLQDVARSEIDKRQNINLNSSGRRRQQ